MARVSIVTGGLELRVGMIRPDVGRLHTCIAVLAIGDGVPGHALHPRHFSHSSTRILDEVILRVQFPNQVEYMLVYCVTELCVITDGFQIPSNGVLSAMLTDSCYAERCTIRGCQYHIRRSELFADIICGNGHNIGIQVDVIEVLILFHREDFVSMGFKGFSNGTGGGGYVFVGILNLFWKVPSWYQCRSAR